MWGTMSFCCLLRNWGTQACSSFSEVFSILNSAKQNDKNVWLSCSELIFFRLVSGSSKKVLLLRFHIKSNNSSETFCRAERKSFNFGLFVNSLDLKTAALKSLSYFFNNFSRISSVTEKFTTKVVNWQLTTTSWW